MDWPMDRSMYWSMVRWFDGSSTRSTLFLLHWSLPQTPSKDWSPPSPAPSMPSPHSPPFLPHRAHTKSLSHDKLVPLPAVSVPSPYSPPFFPHIDWSPCRRQRELERLCVWDREWGFIHCRWKVTTFRDIVDCSQHKCKRKNWFLFYSFLWTCWETAKYKALEIFYRAYAGALKGW